MDKNIQIHRLPTQQICHFFVLEYTQIGTDEALPLGEEFQDHIRCFMDAGQKKIHKQYARISKIIEQLGWAVLVKYTLISRKTVSVLKIEAPY